MKKILLSLSLVFTLSLRAQSLYFPPLAGNTWDTLAPASLGWCQPSIDSLYDYLEVNNSKAFILLQDGKIVLEKYFGTFTGDSLWYWASAGKTLTALTVGIAQQEGHLSLQDTTSQYLGTGWTACTPQQEEKITIWHQLTMTSGLDDLTGDPYCTLDTCLQYVADAGTRWAYHNGPYTLLDGVIANATGMSLNAYVTQKILAPTGMTGAFFPSGYNNIFVSKPRSMARFGLLLLGRGKWNGLPVLNDTAYFHSMTHPSQNLNRSYGYLTWLNGQTSFMLPYSQFVIPGQLCPAAPPDMFAAVGKNGQFINVVPSQNLVFIRMGNASNTADVSLLLNDTIWQYINRLGCTTDRAGETLAHRPKLWPNPGSTTLHLRAHAPMHTPVTLSLLDMQGRVVWTEVRAAAQEWLVNLPAALPAGVYVAEVQAEGQVWRERWVRVNP